MNGEYAKIRILTCLKQGAPHTGRLAAPVCQCSVQICLHFENDFQGSQKIEVRGKMKIQAPTQPIKTVCNFNLLVYSDGAYACQLMAASLHLQCWNVPNRELLELRKWDGRSKSFNFQMKNYCKGNNWWQVILWCCSSFKVIKRLICCIEQTLRTKSLQYCLYEVSVPSKGN